MRFLCLRLTAEAGTGLMGQPSWLSKMSPRSSMPLSSDNIARSGPCDVVPQRLHVALRLGPCFQTPVAEAQVIMLPNETQWC